MNVMVYNKYKELLMGLNIEVMKSMEGVYNVDEIIEEVPSEEVSENVVEETLIEQNNYVSPYYTNYEMIYNKL